MTDDKTRLRQTLAELHAELESIGPVDPEVEVLLSGAVADIQQALDAKSAATAAGQHSIIGRLRTAARHYEESHPTLSGILGNIIDTLSRMGI